MAISDEQPVNVGNLKAVFDAYRNEQSAIAGTYIDYDENVSTKPQIGGDITFSYKEYGPSSFTFNTGGVFLVEEISSVSGNSSGTGWNYTVVITLPDGTVINTGGIDTRRTTHISDRRITVQAGQKLTLDENSNYGINVHFRVKMHRIA